MADLTLNLSALWQDVGTKEFADALATLGYVLPVTEQAGEIGEIVDANGANILQVDPLGVRDDAEVTAIAALVTLAINLAAGFPPIAASTSPPVGEDRQAGQGTAAPLAELGEG